MVVGDVYDLLEGTLDTLVRMRGHDLQGIDLLVQAQCLEASRAAVAMLAALMRRGYTWRPAVDGYEAAEWREILIEENTDSPPSYRALVVRELDELVELTRPGPRRPLPVGAFERFARAAGVHRWGCRSWARDAGDDMKRGWAACPDASSLSQLALAFGFDEHHQLRTLLGVLLDHARPAELRDLLARAIPAPASIDAARIRELTDGGEYIDRVIRDVLVSVGTREIDAFRIVRLYMYVDRAVPLDELRERMGEL